MLVDLFDILYKCCCQKLDKSQIEW